MIGFSEMGIEMEPVVSPEYWGKITIENRGFNQQLYNSG